LTHGLPIAWFVFEKSKEFASLATLEASSADVVLRSNGSDLSVAIWEVSEIPCKGQLQSYAGSLPGK
jgi:hypothetical protein